MTRKPTLRATIEELTRRRWPPAQICQHLRATHPDDPSMNVVLETIYRDLYDWRSGARKREYCRMLRTTRSRRKPRRLIPRRRARFKDALTIRDRPFPPEDRSVPGAWEGP